MIRAAGRIGFIRQPHGPHVSVQPCGLYEQNYIHLWAVDVNDAAAQRLGHTVAHGRCYAMDDTDSQQKGTPNRLTSEYGERISVVI